MPRTKSGKPSVGKPERHFRKWRVRIRFYDDRGRRKTRLRAYDTKEEADAYWRQFRSYRRIRDTTIGQLVDDYKTALTRKGNKPESIKQTEYRLKRLLDFDRALDLLTADYARRSYERLAEESGVAVDTHHGSLMESRAFCGWLVKHGHLPSNPFAAVESIGRKSHGKPQLTIDELRAFVVHCLDAWEYDRDRSAIAVLLPVVMGLRASEVCQLRARDVDNAGALLRVGQERAKTASSKRTLPIPPWLRETLLVLAGAPQTTGHLFAKDKGGAPDRFWLLRKVKEHVAAANLTETSAHALRGAFSTTAAKSRAAIEAVSETLGHTATSMTKRHYIEGGTIETAHAVEIAELLKPKETA